MASETQYLIDNSAFLRARKAPVARRIEPLLHRGLLFTCPPLELEAGRGMDSSHYERMVEVRRQSLISALMPDSLWERAASIQAALASRSTHQGPSVIDILAAVCADHNGLTVLHYDADFDTIAAATAIRTEWVVPRGQADGPDETSPA